MVHVLEGVAASDAALGGALRAAHIWGAAERMREEIGLPHSADERHSYEVRVAATRVQSSKDAAFDRAWREGRAMTLDAAMALALGKITDGNNTYPGLTESEPSTQGRGSRGR
jgi:hypothetical protein